MVTLLGGGLIPRGIQQIASQSPQLSLVVPLPRRLDDLCSLGEAIQSFNQLPEHSMGLGEPRIQSRCTCNSTGSTYCRQSMREQREAFPCLPESYKTPSARCYGPTQK